MHLTTSLLARAALLLCLVAFVPAGISATPALAIPCDPIQDPDCEDPGDTTPPNTSINSGPANGGLTSDTTPSFGFSATEAGSHFDCKVDGGSYASCTSPKTTSALADGSHTFYVKATDDEGNTDPTPASRTFTVDNTNPVVAYTGGLLNAARTSDTTPSWNTSVTDAHGGQRKCKVDAAAYVDCSSPWTAPAQANGAHTVYIKAVDDAGNESSPVTRTFTVDTLAPTAQINGAAALSNDATPTFAYSAPHDGGGNYTFQCKIDGGAPVPCNGGQSSGSYTPPALDDGPHTFSVKATDSTGNAQGGYTSTQFDVDTVAPVVQITAGPADGATALIGPATFEFTAGEAGATLECKLDGGAYGPCSSPLTTPFLNAGPHQLAVRATDSAGNVGPASTRSFTAEAPAAPAQPGQQAGGGTTAKGGTTGGTASSRGTGSGSTASNGGATAGGSSKAALKKKAAAKKKCKRVVKRLKSGKKVRVKRCATKKARKVTRRKKRR